MLETLTGIGLASAAGLNAYIPLLAIGLLGRFTDLVSLPAGWAWITNDWMLILVAVLGTIELIADKVPVVDSINDVAQTVIRPASGGIVFGAGTAATTTAVADPGGLFTEQTWISVVVGIVISLSIHLAKASTRAAATTTTAGVVTPVISTGEDAMSIGFVAAALLAPVLVLLLFAALILLALTFVRMLRIRRRTRRELAARPA
ncbi:DUF4126 domain-containing protein [Gulosibacter sp. GYB002]|uniref:DUF4126 domain-containing protein n=1 Tax=Gulosibacter sp. GYB002 TaxID=2994391 RepID=UPI002F961BC3